LGPVRPRYVERTPKWVKEGRFYERPEHATGFVLGWEECRAGNFLMRRWVVSEDRLPFRPAFGTGGEDQDFFRRKIQEGCRFIWCNQAVVHEEVPPGRCTRSFLIRRALLRGKNSLRHPTGRPLLVAKSLIAVPAYILALPVLCIWGHHKFMRYVVKLSDHLGRLLAVVGINWMRERPG
jgi:hypothetical protein